MNSVRGADLCVLCVDGGCCSSVVTHLLKKHEAKEI